MNKLSTTEQRELVIKSLTRLESDIKYIKEKINGNEKYLININGRVRKNERAISYIKGVGGVVGAIIGIVIGVLTKK